MIKNIIAFVVFCVGIVGGYFVEAAYNPDQEKGTGMETALIRPLQATVSAGSSNFAPSGGGGSCGE